MKVSSQLMVGAGVAAAAGFAAFAIARQALIRRTASEAETQRIAYENKESVRLVREAGELFTGHPPRDYRAAGSMFVGAVDEVELAAGIARLRSPGGFVDDWDPEEVPSEHPEMNELRGKMPMG